MAETFAGPNIRYGGLKSPGVDCVRQLHSLPVPSFGPLLRCQRRGRVGADARPNWQERAPHLSIPAKRHAILYRQEERNHGQIHRSSLVHREYALLHQRRNDQIRAAKSAARRSIFDTVHRRGVSNAH